MMLVATACASGCATYRYGTHQAIAVTTDPPGATCRFERHGKVVASIDKTPGTASVERSIFITRLTCSCPDHFDESVELLTERAADLAARDPAQLGDVITDNVAAAAYQVGTNFTGASAAVGAAAPALGLGLVVAGPVMMAVDLSTSAWVGFRPPPAILLPRGKFESEAERDDHFAARRRDYVAQAESMRGEMADECWRARCAYELQKFDQAFAARLRRLETLRLKAAIHPPQP